MSSEPSAALWSLPRRATSAEWPCCRDGTDAASRSSCSTPSKNTWPAEAARASRSIPPSRSTAPCASTKKTASSAPQKSPTSSACPSSNTSSTSRSTSRWHKVLPLQTLSSTVQNVPQTCPLLRPSASYPTYEKKLTLIQN